MILLNKETVFALGGKFMLRVGLLICKDNLTLFGECEGGGGLTIQAYFEAAFPSPVGL